ncbi:MAG: pyridoxamine 5'-phosphate oxidase family protein [Actinomycetota bacterium]
MNMFSPSDRRLEHLTLDECWELLRPGGVGRLAVTINGDPDIFPVNYVVDGSRLVIRTAAGLKLAAAVLGRSVAFEVDHPEPESRTAWSVVLRGPAREIDDLEGLLRAEDLDLVPWTEVEEKNRYFAIEPVAVTGRRIDDGAEEEGR